MTPTNEIERISNSLPIEKCPNNLTWLFSAQQKLMEEYALQNPNFKVTPLNYIKSREDQSYIKGIFMAFEEEIMEFYEQYLITMDAWLNNKKEEIRPMIICLNEEISDMVHFLFEILILSGITEENLVLYYSELSKEKNRSYPGGLPTTIFGFAKMYISGEYYDLRKPMQIYMGGSEQRLTWGCRRLDPDYCMELEKHLWQLTYHIKQCIRQIPYKPWKIKQKDADPIKYQKMLMEVFLHFFNILAFVDIYEPIFYHLYQVKNEINFNRIKSGY